MATKEQGSWATALTTKGVVFYQAPQVRLREKFPSENPSFIGPVTATTLKKQVTVKLLVDRTANKVLFAEAGKDFVDFLIGLLSLPLASVIRVLTKEKMVGTLGELYESVDNLDKTYIQSSASMTTRVMRPVATLKFTPASPDLKSTEITNAIKYYSCGSS
ncbi:hypothetical protein Sjap_012636 [Stephania japonica]|uniref:Uncharacterized protein n=1 Tax=Stephania japonica TaxID=461633 RepID=A0AAP0IWF8_9MAGN